MKVRNVIRSILSTLLTIVLLLAFIRPASAVVLGPPDDGSDNGGSEEKEKRYVVKSYTEERPPDDWLPSNQWKWTHKVDGSHTGGIHKVTLEWAPGYPKNVDELSHTRTLRYDFIDTTEGTYYIEDDYRDWLRYYYDLVRLERGHASFRGMCWSRVWYRNVYNITIWSDGDYDEELVGIRTSTLDGPGETNPHSVCNLAPYSLVNPYDWSFDEYDEPLKAPPVYVPIPPSGIVPPPVYSGYEAYLGGKEIIRNDYKTRDDWGKGGTWLFGGRPVYNLFAAARGETAIVGIDTLAQGDPRVKPALNKVTEVIVSVDGIPRSTVKAALSSGTPQKGQWIAPVHVPFGTKIGRYRITFDIRGTNYWGEPRRKVVYAWFQVTGGNTVDPGCKPWQKDCGRKVGFCGLDEDDMRRLGDVWRYECVDPRLVK